MTAVTEEGITDVTDVKKDTSNLDENTSDAEECDLEVVEGASAMSKMCPLEKMAYFTWINAPLMRIRALCRAKKAHLELIRTFLTPRRSHVTW